MSTQSAPRRSSSSWIHVRTSAFRCAPHGLRRDLWIPTALGHNMASRTFPPLPPRLIFTRDFRELLRGDLAPGRVVALRYDPARIARDDTSYVFGDPARPIVAHAGFRPGDTPLSRTLVSRSGRLENPDLDPTGN